MTPSHCVGIRTVEDAWRCHGADAWTPAAILPCIPRPRWKCGIFHQPHRHDLSTCNAVIALKSGARALHAVAARYHPSMRLGYEAYVTRKNRDQRGLPHFCHGRWWRSKNRHNGRRQVFVAMSSQASTTTPIGLRVTRSGSCLVNGVTCFCRKQKGRRCGSSLLFCRSGRKPRHRHAWAA